VFEGKVECPRCHKVWTLSQASPGIYCDCHLYCEEGSQPRDCALTEYKFSGQRGWPLGMDQNQLDEGENRHRAYGYCTTHNRYSYKEPIWLEVDWKKWYAKKELPSKMREMQRR
jgi:hypothetical protein